MNGAAWAYAGYLAWLVAGLGDFVCHRRQCLAQTSGVAESTMHLLQLALLGAAVMIWLAFGPSLAALGFQVLLVCAHAAAGYVDTRIAYRTRAIPPVEQHLHSVLDMAPWIALAVLFASEGAQAWQAGWTLPARAFAVDRVQVWGLVLVPPLLLCVLPAVLEFRQAARAARARDADISSVRIPGPR
ncbi:hypothetical protein [Luteimonas sp. FCS-9]|uniref:hypothetical protein n=1 Tax=Luteimonas sp. FCS-9 TaxID=1547516 RepID=UPI00063EB840|nr:hypothetical protein [Luteimonas sp. FCS-9]KLJ01663.1 hypothetical protein WQ56_05140 [Luteimonas sp. FCS-9]